MAQAAAAASERAVCVHARVLEKREAWGTAALAGPTVIRTWLYLRVRVRVRVADRPRDAAMSLRARTLFVVAAAASALNPTNLYLNLCAGDGDSAAAFQTWTRSAQQLRVNGSSPAFCLDSPSKSEGALLRTAQCGSGPYEGWDVSPTAVASTSVAGLCVSADAPSPGAVINGTPVVFGACADADTAFALAPATGRITHSPSGLCVDYGSQLRGPPFCSTAPQSAWPFCDPAAPLDARAADIVGRLSLDDKIRATVSASPVLTSVGLPAYQWWSEATHGIGGPGVTHNATLPGATNTALPITTSCSFNRTLWRATGNAIAREGRAYANNGLSGLTFWTPVINIVRDPRWGRNLESAGEDPFLSGQYAAEFIQGFEHATETPYPLQGSTCCKHFIAVRGRAQHARDNHSCAPRRQRLRPTACAQTAVALFALTDCARPSPHRRRPPRRTSWRAGMDP